MESLHARWLLNVVISKIEKKDNLIVQVICDGGVLVLEDSPSYL